MLGGQQLADSAETLSKFANACSSRSVVLEQGLIPVADKLTTFKELETSGLPKLLIWIVNTLAVWR